MLKLTGREVIPELENVIRGTAEAAVFSMKLHKQKIDRDIICIQQPLLQQSKFRKQHNKLTKPSPLIGGGLFAFVDIVGQINSILIE